MVTNQLPQKKSAYSEASGVWGLLAVCLISVVFVLQVFGVDFVRGSGPFWLSQVHDVAQYIAGFNMYFTAPWQLPLLAFDSLNYPIGTRVTFVDAIPIYALLLKLVVPLGWAPFNPFGFWVGLCFLMQGFSAWWICRELKAESWPLLLSLLAVLLTFPALLARLGHISLMSHWILLFAIALYIRGFQQGKLPIGAWCLLLLSAFYINVYLFVMASGVIFASLFDLGRRPSARDAGQFLSPFVLLGMTLFVMLLPLPPSEISREWGFGYYSMNLLSPFLGGSLIPIEVTEEPGQYEGYNYLGLGVLLATAVVFLKSPQWVFKKLIKHWPLVALMIVFAFYALSSQVFVGSQKLFDLNYPKFLDAVTSQFRASGRFFWPVGYCVVVFSLYGLYKSYSTKALLILVSLLVSMQVLDLAGRFEKLQIKIEHSDPAVMNYKSWDHFLIDTKATTIYFYPKFKCGDGHYQSLLPLMRYASERGFSLNTGYIARYTPDCTDMISEIQRSDPERSVYVFVRDKYANVTELRTLFPKSHRIDCSEIDFAYVCKVEAQGIRDEPK